MSLFQSVILRPFLNALETHAERTAFVIDETAFTYKELGQRIGGLYKEIELSQSPVVGIITHDHIDTYAAIWGIWLAGKSYVPINPTSPVDLNERIKSQLSLELIIDSDQTQLSVSNHQLDCSSFLGERRFSDSDLAYTLFTSGSTGVPKGVPITNGNLAHFIDSFWAMGYELSPTDRGLQMFELTFDLSVISYLAPLICGGSVYTIPKDRIKFAYIFELMTEHDLTIALMVPSMLNFLKPYFDEIDCPSLRYSLFCGEALHLDILTSWSKCVPNARIDNVYGPTENTIFCTYYTYSRSGENSSHNGILSIGKSMTNTLAKVFNQDGALAGVGELGELCLAGCQLTPGYLNNLELNKIAFFDFDDPQENQNIRYYHSGDLCIQEFDGNLSYAGRKDTQIKIQGFRVELSEIEFQAKSFFEQPINIITVVTENKQGNSELILIIESPSFEISSLKKHLDHRLAGYMLPKEIKFLESFPLNINGKIDRNAIKKIITAPSYTMRAATLDDVTFLIEAIIAAERGNTNFIGLANLIGIPEIELPPLLRRFFEEEVDGCEFYANHFTIAELNGKPVGALSTWIEGNNSFEQSSSVLKSNLFGYHLGRERMVHLSQYKNALDQLRLTRTPGVHQIEYVYVQESHRGQNLVSQMIAFSLKEYKEKGLFPLESEIEVFSNNEKALKAYEKIGFALRSRATCVSNEVKHILPHNEKVQLYRKNLRHE